MRTILLIAMGMFLAGAISVADAEVRDGGPTFTRDVAPIFFANCVSCHRPGEVAPMSLITYEEARPWAKSILKNIRERLMPPWHADPGYGPFANDRSLTQKEIDTIVQWANLGAPQGDPRHLPATPEFPNNDWRLGEPDYIIEFDEVEVPGGGPDEFHVIDVKTDFPEDRWIKAIEVMPGDRQVVHHMILWQGKVGGSEQQGWLGAWAAGADPIQFPEGTGRLLKKGGVLVGDFHYHPAEDPRRDITRIGIYFAEDEEIEKELINLWVMNVDFEIPAGDPNAEARSSYTFPQDSHILGLSPHLHYRGKDFSYTVTYPDGRTEELLKVSKYDFNWQTGYEFAEPITIPKGTRIDCVAHWDNSADNPSNPDPTKTVYFGPESFDEMMIGFVDYIVDEGVRPINTDPDRLVTEKIAQLVADHPGEVYKVRIQTAPGQPVQLTALHIPREGEGGWFVPFGQMVGRARIYEIVWEGDSFEAKAFIPGEGVNELKGSFDASTGVLDMTMTDPEGDSAPVQAQLADN